MLRFLIKRNANPSIACMIDDKNEETPLGCAVRWGYTEVTSKEKWWEWWIEVMLENEMYCKAELKTINRLRRQCRNKDISVLLKETYSKYKE